MRESARVRAFRQEVERVGVRTVRARDALVHVEPGRESLTVRVRPRDAVVVGDCQAAAHHQDDVWPGMRVPQRVLPWRVRRVLENSHRSVRLVDRTGEGVDRVHVHGRLAGERAGRHARRGNSPRRQRSVGRDGGHAREHQHRQKDKPLPSREEASHVTPFVECHEPSPATVGRSFRSAYRGTPSTERG